MEPQDEGLRRRVGLLVFIVVLVMLAGLVAWLVTRDSNDGATGPAPVVVTAQPPG